LFDGNLRLDVPPPGNREARVVALAMDLEQKTYAGSFATNGGVVEVRADPGVTWGFYELR
jgi:hypothetical protein